MGTGVQGLKHAAKVQEWSVRIAECRGSGIGVKAWCREHGIALKTYYNWERHIVKAAASLRTATNAASRSIDARNAGKPSCRRPTL